MKSIHVTDINFLRIRAPALAKHVVFLGVGNLVDTEEGQQRSWGGWANKRHISPPRLATPPPELSVLPSHPENISEPIKSALIVNIAIATYLLSFEKV